MSKLKQVCRQVISYQWGNLMSEDQDYNQVIHSSANEFDDFIKGAIWADMKRELSVWLEGVRGGLEDPKTTDRDRLMDVGRADALKYFRVLPETIRDGLIVDQEIIPDEEDKSEELEDLLDE